MFEWITDLNSWLALGSLIILEIVLGIDNIIFLSLTVAKLPKTQQNLARRLGLLGAMMMRLGLLASIAWIIQLNKPLFTLFSHPISIRDLILLSGGLFLIWKASHEIHDTLDEDNHGNDTEVELFTQAKLSFTRAVIQIAILDIVFSLDSVITAVGLSRHLFIMMAAIVIAIIVMMFAIRPIGEFIDRYPSIKMLALAFLILVGFTLILQSVNIDVPKEYIYFAMFFSMGVEMLNITRQRNQKKKRRAKKKQLTKK